MRILLVITEMPPVRSGVALVGAQLAAGYRRAGHQVATLTRRDVGAVGSGEIRLSGMALARRKARSAIAGADVVHLHGPAPTFADAFLLVTGSAAHRAPVVYTHHFDLDYRGLGWLCAAYNRWQHRLVRRRAAALVVTTEQYRARLGGSAPAGEPDARAIEVVPLGCDHLTGEHQPGEHQPGEHQAAERPPGDEEAVLAKHREGSPLRVLFVGQMRPYKGVPVLLRALARTAGVTCRLVGGGPQLDRYRGMARARGVDAAFLGSVDDATLIEQLRWAHAVVLPSVSTHEAFGLALLEGMRFGCVPVSSELPGVSEVAAGCGLLTPPGDAAALAAALERLRAEPERRTELARVARRRALGLTWERTVDRYLRRFEEVTAAREVGDRGAA